MFEGLKTFINRQNLKKLKSNQRYSCEDDEVVNESRSLSDSRHSDEVNQHRNIFEKIVGYDEQQEVMQPVFSQYQKEMYRKCVREKEMLEEQIKINEEIRYKQLRLFSETKQRQIALLQMQKQKLEYIIKRQVKQEKTLISLKNDNRKILELHEEDLKQIEKLSHELIIMKRQNIQLKMNLKIKEQESAQLMAVKHLQTQTQIRLKQQLAQLKQQKVNDAEKRKILQQSIQKLKKQNEDLDTQIQRLKITQQGQIIRNSEKYKAHIVKLQQENKQLKKRNQLIQDSFINHLTQTSLNLQQNIKTYPQRSIRQNQSLYLPQSPIRARSKDHDRQKKKRDTIIQEDPQKTAPEPCKCKNQIQKIRCKLDLANQKIVQLLREKCQGRVPLIR